MVISRDALIATDHARGMGAVREFVPCELDPAEGFEAVRKPIMDRSVVTTKLLTRAPNWDFTADK
jgi:hypothetical protein